MLSKLEMKRYYDTMEQSDPARFAQRFKPGIMRHPVLEHFTRMKLDLVKKYAPSRPRRLLDIGCGTGFYLPLLSRCADNVTAVDISGSMARVARSYAKRNKLSNVAVREMDFEALDFPDSSFDAVVSMDVLHHAADIPGTLKETARVLKKGGLFLAVEVNPLNPLALAHNLLRKEERGVLKTFPAALSRLVRRRFRILKTEYLQYWPYFPAKTPPSALPLIRMMDAALSRIPLLSRLSVYYALACVKTGRRL
jgi:ubiquinone/menaquinone biosynthesis C-methylase UbiE